MESVPMASSHPVPHLQLLWLIVRWSYYYDTAPKCFIQGPHPNYSGYCTDIQKSSKQRQQQQLNPIDWRLGFKVN